MSQMTDTIRRGFVDLPWGQIHYRACGAGVGRPLVMLHANPGSSATLTDPMRRLGASRPVIAPDTPGLGDSAPLPAAQPDIADYAAAVIEALDRLGLGSFDLYGTHTGANIAIEIALARPRQAQRLILDAIALYTPELRQDLLEHYARPMPPRPDGAHLTEVWHFVRDQWLFWPWFRRDAAHRRAVDMADPRVLHEMVVDVLKASTTYHLAYRASFLYAKETRLPQLRLPTLMACPESDIFFEDFRRVAALVPGGTPLVVPSGPDSAAFAAAAFARFLDGGSV